MSLAPRLVLALLVVDVCFAMAAPAHQVGDGERPDARLARGYRSRLGAELVEVVGAVYGLVAFCIEDEGAVDEEDTFRSTLPTLPLRGESNWTASLRRSDRF